MKVAVVIVNWNGWRDCIECIESLDASVSANVCRVLIVDNGSTDDSVEQLGRFFRRKGGHFKVVPAQRARSSEGYADCLDLSYVVIQSDRNRGFAAGNNLGIALALSIPETRYVFLLNNDTHASGDAIEMLVAHAEKVADSGVIGSTLVEGGGSVLIAGGYSYNWLLTINRPQLLEQQPQGRRDYLAGAAMFVPIKVFQKCGLLCEDYFLYYEEIEFALRARREGFSLLWCPESVIVHKRGRSAGTSADLARRSTLSEYHSSLSCLRFTRKTHPGMFWCVALLRLLLKVFQTLTHGQPRLLGAVMKAYRDYWAEGRQA